MIDCQMFPGRETRSDFAPLRDRRWDLCDLGRRPDPYFRHPWPKMLMECLLELCRLLEQGLVSNSYERRDDSRPSGCEGVRWDGVRVERGSRCSTAGGRWWVRVRGEGFLGGFVGERGSGKRGEREGEWVQVARERGMGQAEGRWTSSSASASLWLGALEQAGCYAAPRR